MRKKTLLKRVISTLLSAVLAVSMLTVTEPKAADIDANLLVNGGFDNAGEAWTAQDGSVIPKQEVVDDIRTHHYETNGGFENGTTGWSLTTAGSIVAANEYVTVDATYKNSGEASLKIAHAEADNNKAQGARYVFDAEANTTYTITYYAFTPTSEQQCQAWMDVYEFDSSGAKAASATNLNRVYVTYNSWKEKTYTFTTTDTTAKVRIDFNNNYYTGAVYIDDFTITSTEASKETKEVHSETNGDFENGLTGWNLTTAGGNVSTNDYVTVDTTYQYSGEASLKLAHAEADNNKAQGVRYTFDAKANTTYTITYYVFTPTSEQQCQAWMDVYEFDSSGTKAASATNLNRVYVTYNNWKEKTYTFTTTETTASVRIDFNNNYYTGAVYLDALTIVSTQEAIRQTYTEGIGTCNDEETDNVLVMEAYTKVSQPVTIQAGYTYRYAFKVKNKGAASDFVFGIQAGENEWKAVTATADWLEVTGSFTATVDAAEFSFTRSGTGKVFLDDVVLSEVSKDGVPSTVALSWMHYRKEGALALKGTFPANEGAAYTSTVKILVNGQEQDVAFQYDKEELSAELASYLSETGENTITIPEKTKFVSESNEPIFYITTAYTIYTQKVEGHWLTWTSEAEKMEVEYVNLNRVGAYQFNNKQGDVLIVEGEPELTLGGDIYSEDTKTSVSTTRLGDFYVTRTVANELQKYIVALYRRGNVHDALDSGETDTLDLRDLIAMKKAIDAEAGTFGYARMKAADVNGDGVIDQEDTARLGKALLMDSPDIEPMILASPANGQEVVLLGGEIYEFATGYSKLSSANYNANKTDIYAPKPVTISWESMEEASAYKVKISSHQDMADPAVYETGQMSVEIEDLYVGWDYYYQVIAEGTDGTVVSDVFHFRTAGLPRTIEVEGVTNTRDIGGYYTADGNYRVKQGMVYRGGSVDDISEDGIEKMKDVYGIQTDLDLRGETVVSPLGTSIRVCSYRCPQYTYEGGNHILKAEYKDALANAIRVFADETNYPIYMHCQIGRDRTGTVAFMLNALLGVGEMDLYRDYELSFLSYGGCSDGSSVERLVTVHFTQTYEYFLNYGEGTLSENVESFMLDYLGLTEQEIQNIKSNMLEKAE